MRNRSLSRVVALAFLGGALGLSVGREADAAGPFQYYAVVPCRAVDTRTGYGGVLVSGAPRNFTMRGVCGIPANAEAVTVNVTIVNPNDLGWLVLYPAGTTRPLAATINFTTNDTSLGNGAIVPLGTAPSNDVTAYLNTFTGVGSIHLVLDVTGYFK